MAVRNYGNRRSPEEVSKSMAAAKKVMAASRRKEEEKNVKYAKNALLFVGILQFVIGLYEAFGPDKMMLGLVIDGGIGLAFVGLWWYAKENAVQAIIIALFVYIGIIALLAFIDITTLFQGVIMRAIVITSLVTGLKSAKKLPQKIKLDDELLDYIEPIDS